MRFSMLNSESTPEREKGYEVHDAYTKLCAKI